MLFENSHMQHGLVNSGFHIFQLVPKSLNPRGYLLYMLPVGDHYYLGEGGSPPCRDLAATDQAQEVKGHEVEGEGTKDLTLRFNLHITPCGGSEPLDRTVAFKVVGGVLKQIAPM